MAVHATPPLLKRLNERTVLEAIRAGAPISRAEISRRAGISKPTVSLALRSLLESGLVREAATAAGGPTYGAVYFEPVPEAAIVAGVDVGARFVRGAICDLGGHVRARRDIELPAGDAGTTIEAVLELRRSLVESTGLAEELVDGTVVGVPGVVLPDGEAIDLATNIAGIEGTAFARGLRERLDGAVTLENDINLAALGERWRGIAQGIDDFVFVSVGTGLGAGLVLRGELHRGHRGAAGEIDYVRAGSDDDDPAAPALTAVAERLAEGVPTTLAPPLDARDVFAAARAGDRVAADVVEDEGRRIARHIAAISGVVDVALVVLGGGVGANGDLLLPVIRPLLAEWLPYPPQVEVSALGDAGVLTGALSVGLDAALDNVFVNRPSR
jgi:predicted NBD/HSP70 family sugar kinase